MWARVVESVRPLDAGSAPVAASVPAEAGTQDAARAGPRPSPGRAAAASPRPSEPPARPSTAAGTAASAAGLVPPDATLDLHGHNLATAYDLLDQRLDEAIRAGARLLLLVTGKPPAPRARRRARARSGRRSATGCTPRATPAGSPRCATPTPATAVPAPSTSCSGAPRP